MSKEIIDVLVRNWIESIIRSAHFNEKSYLQKWRGFLIDYLYEIQILVGQAFLWFVHPIYNQIYLNKYHVVKMWSVEVKFIYIYLSFISLYILNF